MRETEMCDAVSVFLSYGEGKTEGIGDVCCN